MKTLHIKPSRKLEEDTKNLVWDQLDETDEFSEGQVAL